MKNLEVYTSIDCGAFENETFSVTVTIDKDRLEDVQQDDVVFDLNTVSFSNLIHEEYLCTPADYNDLEEGLQLSILGYFEDNKGSWDNKCITAIRVEL